MLHGLGLDKIEYQDNYLEVYNKTDLLSSFIAPPAAAAVSALNGEGCDRLLKRLDDILSAGSTIVSVDVAAADGKMLAWLHQNGEVVACRQQGEKLHLEVKMDPAVQNRLNVMLKQSSD